MSKGSTTHSKDVQQRRGKKSKGAKFCWNGRRRRGGSQDSLDKSELRTHLRRGQNWI